MTNADFLDVVMDKSGGSYKLPKSNYAVSGEYPVIDQGQDAIAGFTDNEEHLYKSASLPVVIFGDHTRAVKYVDYPFAMGADGVKVLKPKKGCDEKYLFHYLRHARIPDAGYSRHYKFLKEIKIPLPSLPEQRRIAAILDKADELRHKRRQAIDKLDQLLQSVFLDMFGDPVTNPRGWDTDELGEILNFTTGKLDSNAAVAGGAYPFFTCSREVYSIDEYAFDTEALLLAGNNAAGEYWVKHVMGKFNAYQRTYVLTKRKDSFTYPYLQYSLQQRLKELQRLSKGSSTKYLTLSILKPLTMLAPPVYLQHEFEKFVTKINAQKLQVVEGREQLDILFESLQKRAFNGTL